MKKSTVFFITALFILSIAGGVLAADAPAAPSGTGAEDVEKIQELIEEKNPIDEDGNFDASGFKPYKSKADERIKIINTWLEENTSWLTFLFGMIPEISWLFAWTLWFFVLALLYLVIKPHVTFFYLPLTGQKPRILGVSLFAFLLVLNIVPEEEPVALLASIAQIVVDWIVAAFITGVILGILVIVALILLAVFAPAILLRLAAIVKARRDQRLQREKEDDIEVIEAQAKALEGTT